jgi:Winged helix-turn helix
MYTDYMPKRLSIQAHLSVDELETRYRRAKEPVARSHWQIIWLLAQGLAFARVAAVTGYTVNWIRTMARRYNQQGPAGLADHRHHNPGAVGLLSPAQRQALSVALERPPPDGASGPAPKRRPGRRQRSAVACIPSGGGRCCGAWGGRQRSRVLAMRKRTPWRRPPLKKPPGRSGGGATSLSSG